MIGSRNSEKVPKTIIQANETKRCPPPHLNYGLRAQNPPQIVISDQCTSQCLEYSILGRESLTPEGFQLIKWPGPLQLLLVSSQGFSLSLHTNVFSTTFSTTFMTKLPRDDPYLLAIS